MSNDPTLRDELVAAIRDYSYLLEREYPQKGILKLTGDRYRLSGEERTLLYRGITTFKQADAIQKRYTPEPKGLLIIDGYNVLLTLLNYRLGHRVFICTDGLCRDSGALFGKVQHNAVFRECISLLSEYLSDRISNEIVIYLDSPVSYSNGHKSLIESIFGNNKSYLQVLVVDSADKSMVLHTSGTYATSDSAVLMDTENYILDIPAAIIREFYHTRLPDLREYF